MSSATTPYGGNDESGLFLLICLRQYVRRFLLPPPVQLPFLFSHRSLSSLGGSIVTCRLKLVTTCTSGKQLPHLTTHQPSGTFTIELVWYVRSTDE